MRFGFRLIAPVDAGVGHQLAEAQGYVDPRIAVAPASLDQTQAYRRVFCQARCEHAPCRAPAGHHHIELDIEILSQERTSHCRLDQTSPVPHSLGDDYKHDGASSASRLMSRWMKLARARPDIAMGKPFARAVSWTRHARRSSRNGDALPRRAPRPLAAMIRIRSWRIEVLRSE